jgi:hypothetical protein
MKRFVAHASLFLSVAMTLFYISRMDLLGNAAPEGEPEEVPPIVKLIAENPYNAMFLSPTLFKSNHIIAYYGHPQSRHMGIVGRYSKEQLAERIKATVARYDKVNGEKGVIPAFYLIYGTAQPAGNIYIMPDQMVESYIHFAATNGILMILDHQIGRFTPQQAIEKLLPFLKYPNVHLAFDAEWRTTRPLKEIGFVTGQELNIAQAMIRDYMIKHDISGKRALIFHEFNTRMIRSRDDARSDYDPVVLIHSTSGWGSPSMKLGTHSRNALATNIPWKGFKLWYDHGDTRPGAHIDRPVMTPEQVLALDPQPVLIMYQ